MDYLRKNKFFALGLLTVLVFLLLFLIGGHSAIKHIDVYQSFFDFYTRAVGSVTKMLLSLTGSEVEYLSERQSLVMNGIVIPMYLNFALRFHIYATAILFLLPKDYLKSSILLLLSFFVLFLISSLKCAFEVRFFDSYGSFLADIMTSLRVVLLLCLITYKININESLKIIYLKANLFIREKIVFNIFQALFLLSVITPVFSLIQYYAQTNLKAELSAFSNVLLFISQSILTILNYNTHIVDRYIYLDKYAVNLGDPCLGLVVTLTFIFIICSIKSNWLNKLIYLFVGSFVMMLMNSIRIAYLLLHLHKYGHYALTMEVHDLSDYFFYTIVFIMIIIYIVWFQNIRFRQICKITPPHL
jgi:exosortase/archaeosortase family protein